MQNLQEHQLRVAAVAGQICESMTVPIDTDSLVKGALIHDMGNIIKFKLEYFPEFNKPEGLEYWQGIKDAYIEKYGADEHEATIKIARELGVDEKVIDWADQNRFSRLCAHRDSDDLPIKILHYADGRVGPHGVLSYDARMDDARNRYKDHKNSLEAETREKLINCGRDIEKQIFSQSKIRPEDITDASIAKYMEELKNFSL